jgi:ECF transporter S component (folate family)
MRKMTVIQKISYSALFIALGIILSRFVSLPFLFGLPFLKVGFTPSLVMFSSLYLGPFWGAIVGTFVDVFGAIMAPQGTGAAGAFNPLYTIPATLTGLVPYFIYKLFNNKFEKKFPVSLTVILLILSTFLCLFFTLNDTFPSESGKKIYTIEPWLKWTIGVGSFALSLVFIVAVLIIRKHFKNAKINKYCNIYTIATSIFLTYFVFKIPVSSLVKSFLLSYNFWFVFVVQSLVGFIACFVHIILVTIALNVTTFFNIRGSLIKEEVKDDTLIDVETMQKEDVKDDKKDGK